MLIFILFADKNLRKNGRKVSLYNALESLPSDRSLQKYCIVMHGLSSLVYGHMVNFPVPDLGQCNKSHVWAVLGLRFQFDLTLNCC